MGGAGVGTAVEGVVVILDNMVHCHSYFVQGVLLYYDFPL